MEAIWSESVVSDLLYIVTKEGTISKFDGSKVTEVVKQSSSTSPVLFGYHKGKPVARTADGFLYLDDKSTIQAAGVF